MRAERGVMMKLLAMILAGGALGWGPAALAEPLKASEIVKSIEGVWGWTGQEPSLREHTCAVDPMRIWLEAGGTIYKSQQVGGGKIYESTVGLPGAKPGEDLAYIVISYANPPQRDLFGQPVVWGLFLPDHDTFVWKQLPLGRYMPPLERCKDDKKARIG